MEDRAHPGLRELRAFGWGLGFLLAVLSALHWREHRTFTWQLPWAGVVWALALAAPGVFSPLYRVWKPVAIVVARAAAATFLAFFFYGVLTPYSWALKLCRVRLLDLKLRDRESYWVPKGAPRARESYRGEF